jgi:hypothetical protein
MIFEILTSGIRSPVDLIFSSISTSFSHDFPIFSQVMDPALAFPVKKLMDQVNVESEAEYQEYQNMPLLLKQYAFSNQRRLVINWWKLNYMSFSLSGTSIFSSWRWNTLQ